MIRNKAPRYRNLQNLHVISTAPTVPVVPFVQPASNVLITVQPTTSIPETPLTSSPNTLNKNIQKSMYSQNKPRNRRRRNKKRKGADHFSSMQNLIPNKNYNWYNSNYLNQESYSTSVGNSQENIDNTDDKMNITEEAENYLEAPGEEDFEEVEVASVDGVDEGEVSVEEMSVDADGKQEILVGFRTSKIHYLKYKKSFFKPKVYKFSSQRTFVNCLNIQDNCSVDVDVVSEADYETEYEGEILDQSETLDCFDKIETEEKKVEDTADVIGEYDRDIKVDNKGTNDNIDEKDDCKLRNEDTKEIKNLDHKKTKKDQKSDVKIMNSTSVDASSVKSKFTANVKTKTSDSKGELNISNKVSESEVRSEKKELTGSNNQNKIEQSEVNQALISNVKNECVKRTYKTSIESNDDIHQGKCSIQDILDSWESHLIGLEYLIEVQNNTNSSTMYNCILCSEDLEGKEFLPANVISHINGREHVVKFLFLFQ